MKLTLCRHQESICNVKGFIQGKKYNLGLSKQGIASAKNASFKKNDFRQILSSPEKRAIETARIYNIKLKLPIIIVPELREFGPGILGDISKEQASSLYPEYYNNIWLKRGDLDGIPKAEKGDNLQARALCFLERYMELESNDLIISHAGLLRSLINTILDLPRTTPIDCAYSKSHIIKGNPWKKIKIFKQSLAKTSKVYKIKTHDSAYILKKSLFHNSLELKFQDEISDVFAKAKAGIIPEILYRSEVNNKYVVQVLKYLPGKIIENELSNFQKKILIKTIFDLERILKQISTSNKPTFRKKFLKMHATLPKSSKTYRDVSILLKNKNFQYLLNNKDSIINYDLHKSNIIFNSNKVHILDLGSYAYAHKVFLPACLLSGLSLSEEPKKILNWVLENFKDINVYQLYLATISRILFGIAFFERKEVDNGLSKNDLLILKSYKKSFEFFKRKIKLQQGKDLFYD